MRGTSRPGLLHNMSCQPTASIRHDAGDRRLYGTGIVFALSPAVGAGNAGHFLRVLDGAFTGSPAQAEAELRRRLDEHALSLPLPAAALVGDRVLKGDVECTDLLTVLTVLAKSSAHVYLRDKEPNLAAVRPGRRIVLTIPPDWRPS